MQNIHLYPRHFQNEIIDIMVLWMWDISNEYNEDFFLIIRETSFISYFDEKRMWNCTMPKNHDRNWMVESKKATPSDEEYKLNQITYSVSNIKYVIPADETGFMGLRQLMTFCALNLFLLSLSGYLHIRIDCFSMLPAITYKHYFKTIFKNHLHK